MGLSNIERNRQKNVAANKTMLEKIGLPVVASKRKFSRHVVNKFSSTEDESESDEGEAVVEKPLADGEEVYLLRNNIKMFSGKYEKTDPGKTTVHGNILQENEGRFFITKVMRNVSKWKDFDVDVMTVGAPILWKKSELMRKNSAVDVTIGTEARNPTARFERKRKRQPEKWQRNKLKKAKNSGEGFSRKRFKDGQSYISTTKKKEMKPACKCKRKCYETFTEAIRTEIFNDFYSPGDKSVQSQQIASLVSETKKERERKRNNNKTTTRSRELSRQYHLFLNGEAIQCCAVMFLNTLSIDEKRVRTVLRKKTVTGTPLIDRRGKHQNHKTKEKERNFVIKHIKTFQVLESHYVRKESKYEYLPLGLTITAMHRMYNECQETKNYPEVTYQFYASVFHECFNLKFQQLKKDRCDTCEAYQNQDPATLTNQMKADQASHMREKEDVKRIKEQLKEMGKMDKSLVVAAFDLQKVILSPYGQVSSFYYSRRLANHNFTITDIVSMETSCFFWNEAQCQKGSCEVATSLYLWLKTKCQQGVTKFELFCDRCGGQNNNRMVFIMLSFALSTLSIESLALTYLVSGHSHSENDNAHSVIERMASNKTVYTPAEWEAVIQCSFKKHPCVFKALDYQDILDFKSPTAFPNYSFVLNDKTVEVMTPEQKEKQKQHNVDIGLPKRKVDKVFWSEITCVKFHADNPETMQFKYSYEEEYRTTHFFSTQKNLRQKQEPCRRKYKKPCGITEQKKKDLLQLCEKQLIPKRHHQFYETLPVNNNKSEK